jgi:hypothetical protein
MKSVEETVTVDDVMDALADVQRRKLLVALLEHNPQDDSPTVLADSESDETAVASLVSMNHVHLPKLAEYGFIEWDRQSHKVEKGPNFDEIRPLLELLDDHVDELPAEWL